MFIIYDVIADIIYDIQVQARKTYAGTAMSDAYHHYTGKKCLDMHLLKPARLDIVPGQPDSDVVCADDSLQARRAHVVCVCIFPPHTSWYMQYMHALMLYEFIQSHT